MKISYKLFGILYIILPLVYSPVLFCVVFIGKNMDYWERMKIVTKVPNCILLIAALVGLAGCMFIFWKCNNIEISLRVNRTINVVLVLLFLALYFFNIRIAKEIVFHVDGDIAYVSGLAYLIADKQEIGYFYYLSMCSNNIVISYILGRLYRIALSIRNYTDMYYMYDFIWVQVNCVLFSIAGFFSCLTVKKLTKKLMPVAMMFLLYLVLVGTSAWKIAPYTDTYGLIFPIISLYFYICYREKPHTYSKYLCLFLSIFVGMAGGFIKPNLYIIVIAIVGCEFICFLSDYKSKWKFILTEIVLVAVLAWGSKAYLDHIIDEIGFEYNHEIALGWQHYFFMGLNEETTGSYNDYEATLVYENQTDRDSRVRRELEEALGRFEDRGFWGSIYFYLRKMVMSFNDGTFGWKTDADIRDQYPYEITSKTALTQKLRSVFWKNGFGYDVGNYNTICQFVWIFSMLGIPGICLCKDKKWEEYGILVICFLGVFFSVMLFEARARYLFAFLPIILPIAVCGIQQYTCCVVSALQRRKEREQSQ